jgi:hypothetical protein
MINRMEDMQNILSQILILSVPFLCFVFIVWYSRRKQKNSGASIPKEAEISSFLSAWFHVTDQPLVLEFSKEGRKDQISLEADNTNVQGIDDVLVRLNGLNMGSLRRYLEAGSRGSKEIRQELIRDCDPAQQKKLLEPYLHHPEGIRIQTLFRDLDQANQTVDDPEVHEENERLLSDLRTLHQEHPDDLHTDKLFTQYFPLYLSILQAYGKLEEAGSQRQKQSYHERLVKTAGLLKTALERAGKEVDQEKYEGAEDLLNGLQDLNPSEKGLIKRH